MSHPTQPGSTCEEVMARLFEHLDGELPPSLDTWVREHLAVCHGCLARTQHQRAFLRCIRSHRQAVQAAEALRSRIEQTLRAVGNRPEPGD
jgi:anti-sigma factor (TIGR02949 family)